MTTSPIDPLAGLPPQPQLSAKLPGDLASQNAARRGIGLAPPPKIAGMGRPVADPKIHKVAKEFEAVFLSEMLRLARPPDKAASGFSAGHDGETWQMFMDQALGKAAAEKGGTGLSKEIETALLRAQGGAKGAQHGSKGVVR